MRLPKNWNSLPGKPVDWHLKLNDHRTRPKKSKWTPELVVILILMFVSFCVGVSLGPVDHQEAGPSVSSAPVEPSKPAVTVTATTALPTVPGSCTMVFDRLMRMQDSLNVVIDSSQHQVVIGNKAYVGIAGNDSRAVSKALSDQYDLNRETSHASRELQEHRTILIETIEQCNIALGR